MLEYCILGFLEYKPMTGYEIKSFMMKSTKHFLFASYGSIYPALKRLENKNWINSIQRIDHGRLKIVYSINNIGSIEFVNWLSKKWDFNNGIEEMLLHIFFGSFLSLDEIIQKIDELQKSIEKRHQELCTLESNLPANHTNRYENATIKFGKDFYIFTKQWLSDYRKELLP